MVLSVKKDVHRASFFVGVDRLATTHTVISIAAFSKTIIRQRQRFATANNSHTQTSHPKRHRLTGFVNEHKKDDLKKSITIMHLTFFFSIGFDRSQQLRGDRSGDVTIEDCWVWLIMSENLFSKTIIRQRQRFATANNSHTQTSRPKRHRLTGFVNEHKKRRLEKVVLILWELTDSNRRPSACKADALNQLS